MVSPLENRGVEGEIQEVFEENMKQSLKGPWKKYKIGAETFVIKRINLLLPILSKEILETGWTLV